MNSRTVIGCLIVLLVASSPYCHTKTVTVTREIWRLTAPLDRCNGDDKPTGQANLTLTIYTRKHVPFTDGTLKYRWSVSGASSEPIFQAVLDQSVCTTVSSADTKVITLPSDWSEDSSTSGTYLLKGEQSVKKSKVVSLIHSFGYSIRTHAANFTSDEAYATVVLLRMNLAGVFNLTSFSSRSMKITV